MADIEFAGGSPPAEDVDLQDGVAEGQLAGATSSHTVGEELSLLGW